MAFGSSCCQLAYGCEKYKCIAARASATVRRDLNGWYRNLICGDSSTAHLAESPGHAGVLHKTFGWSVATPVPSTHRMRGARCGVIRSCLIGSPQRLKWGRCIGDLWLWWLTDYRSATERLSQLICIPVRLELGTNPLLVYRRAGSR